MIPVVILFLVSCIMSDKPVLSNAQPTLVAADTKFALSLYKHVAVNCTGNVFMSPVSISVAMAMTYLGARGSTVTQMRDALHFGDVSNATLHSSFAELTKALSNVSDNKYVLKMANRLFGEKTYKFRSKFLSEERKYYGAQLARMDFVNNASRATTQINQWVAQRTNQKIKDMIPPGVIDSTTRLVLVNAAYFKSNWSRKFQATHTSDTNFYMTPSKTVPVPMMYQSVQHKFRYGSAPELACEALELPFVDSALSMFVLLPRKTSNITELEAKLTPEHLINIETNFHMRVPVKVNVWLPRFNVTEHFDLTNTFKQLGVVDLFVNGKADLSGMDGTRDLYVSTVLHQAFINVNENGCEAAAATVVAVGVGSAFVQDVVDFRADRPFIFFIRHNESKSVLFLGRLVKP